MYPGDLESTYPDPNNPEVVLGRSEVKCRKKYTDQLEKELCDGKQHPLTRLIEECLQNAPSRRPTTEQLVTALQEMREEIEDPCGAVTRIDAVRQVVTMKEILGRENDVREKINKLMTKIRRFYSYSRCK